jgi:hypothetical protein
MGACSNLHPARPPRFQCCLDSKVVCLHSFAKVLIASAAIASFNPSSAASAEGPRWAWCTVVPERGLRYVSPHFAVTYESFGWLKIQAKWQALVRRQGITDGWEPECYIQGSADRPKTVYYPPGTSVNVGGVTASGGVPFMQTVVLFPGLAEDWFVDTSPKAMADLGGPPPVKATRPPEPGSLTIEDNGIAARTKAWDNQLLQARREASADKVKRAIATKESKAEYDRLMAQVKVELKRLGRMQ